ncbi:MAG: hydroxymethylpyrimidine/phosphomethylpyrimidine kinase [Methylobacter sp.]|nr:MAG: hydroxymethylpyrimidine/phosphomethylpyrimidine kinase [Methylobacter sp.]
MSTTSRPTVLVLSGHDPSGGAGLQADIETLASQQCHAASIITALTEQDTHNVKTLLPQSPEAFLCQAKTLLADVAVSAVKIGLIGSPDLVLAIAEILALLPKQAVVLDPVLAAGGGASLAGKGLIDNLKHVLLPKTTVLTPNSQEARKLSGVDDLTASGLALLDSGCEYVLITGSHEHTKDVCNLLFHDGRLLETYTWPRLPYSYHGSGCTLASAVAAALAQGKPVETAIRHAQDFTWHSLKTAFRISGGQAIPNRFFELIPCR